MPAVPFQANQQFGQYTLLRPIAVGGMAEVWLAKLDGVQGFQKKVALKRMTGTIAEQPQFVTMFLDEARLMSGLTHPNICQVIELGQRDENFYVAMEFIDGQTVQHVMRAVTRANRQLPVELAIKIARDVADALHYAHTKKADNGTPLNVIHRDVSPQNIMVTYEGAPKLLDFGIAKAATRTNATEVGQLKGKLSYMPPEQARGELLDPRADQFSLGVVLFEMLTHTRLYPPLKEMDLFRVVAMAEAPYETPRQREPRVPEELSALVAKMMARLPEDRYASLADVSALLTAYLHANAHSVPSNEALSMFMSASFPPDQREKVTTEEPSSPVVMGRTSLSSAPGRSKKRVLAALALMGLLGTAALAAFAWWPARPAPVETPPVAELIPIPVAIDAGPPVLVVEREPEPEVLPVKEEPKVPGKRIIKGKGLLSLQTVPWTNVMFGGKNLGETPLVGVRFPVGKHRLVLINDERQLRTTIEVEIKPNQTTTLKLKL